MATLTLEDATGELQVLVKSAACRELIVWRGPLESRRHCLSNHALMWRRSHGTDKAFVLQKSFTPRFYVQQLLE